MYELSDYDYNLPPELIAQKPAEQRDRSRLLVLDRHSGARHHGRFDELPTYLRTGDMLVINNTEVVPGRLFGRKSSGGRVEVLIIDYAGGQADAGQFTGRCLVRASKAPRAGARLHFDQDLTAEVIGGGEGIYTLRFTCPGNFEDRLYAVGRVPLPPYIKRPGAANDDRDDRSNYQTVYASEKGAVAAPTAGFHFTRRLLADLAAAGVNTVAITLHVGYGTFLPVRADDIRQHRMHAERYRISAGAADRLNAARRAGDRIVAVGTTSVRTLEYAADENGRIRPGTGNCDLFIYPGYRFKVIDALVTNFHLPRSTLLMLVSALAGRETVLAAYREAIREKYRFYSYGDAMLIL
jgi:S-adenosylmethionine:tRNA ribosyltransferase-isomerase